MIDVIPDRGQVCREKVPIVTGDAPLLISKPLLQRMGAVLHLEQGQVTFNKLGVTLDLGESPGHHVIDLIPDRGQVSVPDDAGKCAQFREASSWHVCERLWNNK